MARSVVAYMYSLGNSEQPAERFDSRLRSVELLADYVRRWNQSEYVVFGGCHN
jgi:hypothetical protein